MCISCTVVTCHFRVTVVFSRLAWFIPERASGDWEMAHKDTKENTETQNSQEGNSVNTEAQSLFYNILIFPNQKGEHFFIKIHRRNIPSSLICQKFGNYALE